MCRCAKKWNISLELKPFLLGGIMQGSGLYNVNIKGITNMFLKITAHQEWFL
jgi:2-hydroxychromene-2-carboxylate isomerase